MENKNAAQSHRVLSRGSASRFPFTAAMACLGFILLFLPTFKTLLERFNAHDSYYSHGVLIPFVSLFLVWRQREQLKRLPKQGASSGLAVVVVGTLVHVIALFLRINILSYAMIPVVVWGGVSYLYGREVTRAVLFPIVFLVFMLPLPSVVIIGVSFKMKLWAAQLAAIAVKALGIPAVVKGSMIYYPGGNLLVGDPCSGLRSLISFLALGALFTQFIVGGPLKKSLLFSSSIAIALLSNVARIGFLVTVSYVYGEKAAMGFVHDASGFMVFVVGFFALIGMTKLLRCPLRLEA